MLPLDALRFTASKKPTPAFLKFETALCPLPTHNGVGQIRGLLPLQLKETMVRGIFLMGPTDCTKAAFNNRYCS